MAVLLEETGARLVMANNGIEALECLGREPFDLVFLDIQMPDMDGYETIRLMRERGFVLPVVAITAHAMQADKQRCLDAGMDAYLSKPFKQALLFETIHTLLPERYRLPEVASCAAPPESGSWDFLPDCISLETVLQTGLSPRQYPAILQSFARNHAQDGAFLRHAVRTHDWASLREKAHALKGAAANLGALHLRDRARTLELEAQARLDKGYPGPGIPPQPLPGDAPLPPSCPSLRRRSTTCSKPRRNGARPRSRGRPSPRLRPRQPRRITRSLKPTMTIWPPRSGRPRRDASASPSRACWSFAMRTNIPYSTL